MEIKPNVIGAGDATHCLIGGTDLKGNVENFPQFGDAALCKSLCVAKALQRENNRCFAQLTLQTVDAEMHVLPDAADVNKTLYFKMS